MDQLFKKWFEKQALPLDRADTEDTERKQGKDEAEQPYGYRQTDLSPHDRLRRSLQRMLPGYPDIFD